MILVDMGMPKGCRFCHLQDVCVSFQREVVTEAVSIDTWNERHKDCPIKAEIPDNATNEDVIKALFPSGNAEPYMSCSKDWWNAPYKAESEG